MFVSLPVGCFFVVVVQSNFVVVFAVYCIVVVEAFQICIVWRSGLSSCKFCMLRFLLGRCLVVQGEICCLIFGNLIIVVIVGLVE